MKKSLIVVDCQYDFIEGSLACINANNAVQNIIDFINENDDIDVFYSADNHSKTNKSFDVNGGIWPIHCVSGEKGSEIDNNFNLKIRNENNAPNYNNIFNKGEDDFIEEYSAFNAKSEDGKVLHDVIENDVIVSGIASEYCVRETVLELLKAGKHVSLLINGLAYVNEDDHNRNIEFLVKKGVELII